MWLLVLRGRVCLDMQETIVEAGLSPLKKISFQTLLTCQSTSDILEESKFKMLFSSVTFRTQLAFRMV